MNQLLRVGIKMSSSQKPKPPQLTHFLCIPLATATSRLQLSQTLASFRDDVTRPKELGGFGLPADAVRPVGTLHLTLGMMSFPNDEGLDKAVELLRSLRPREVLSTVKKLVMPGETKEAVAPDADAGRQQQPQTQQQVLITLKGLHPMQKAEKATVLYAPPSDPYGILQSFGEKIKAEFKEAGLLAPGDLPLLLHATIVNTIYVKGRGKHGAGKKKWERTVIKDAQAMVDRYEDQVWMEDVPLDKIAICRMSAKPIEKDGVVVDAAYEAVAEVDF
jgi:activating signal cointegrator complex subunit 1